MEDVSEKLLKDLQGYFNREFNNNKRVMDLYAKARTGKGTYRELHSFAKICGETLEDAFRECVKPGDLPNEKMYYNIAEKLLKPLLGNNYKLVGDFGEIVQNSLNDKAKIGIRAIRPDFDDERVDNLVAKISHEANFAEAKWLTEQPITNMTLQMADDFAKANFDFHAQSGLAPTVTRIANSGACEWCSKLAGTYDYESVRKTGNDVWKRHDSCRCMVIPSFQKYANVATGHSFQG